MSSGIDPEQQFKVADIEVGLRASLETIYGKGSSLVDGVIAHSMGSLALGVKPESEERKDDRPYAERLKNIQTPEELRDLVYEGINRLRPRIANYLYHKENGTLHPYIHTDPNDRHELTGQLWIFPPQNEGSSSDNVLQLRLEGGTSSPWDPLDEGSEEETRYEHVFSVKTKRVYDPLTKEYIDLPYVHTTQELGTKFGFADKIKLKDIESYSLNWLSPEFKIVQHVLEHLDNAIDWYENVYPIAPNGVSYGKVKELGYVDADGKLLDNWFDLMATNHRNLLWPETVEQT